MTVSYDTTPNRFAEDSRAHSAPSCGCDCMQKSVQTKEELVIHTNAQDENCPGWKTICRLVDEAATDGREVFAPGREMAPEEYHQLVTLPPSISKLTKVKKLVLYGSSIMRIPPEIGDMTNLEEFHPYTSYALHWFPYEITRCKKLRDSTISTRAIYGNHKIRMAFPKLPCESLPLPKCCSVCKGPFSNKKGKDGKPHCEHQAWISLRVATDIMPLLVHACSQKCLQALPVSPKEKKVMIPGPHQGGRDLTPPKQQKHQRNKKMNYQVESDAGNN